jgi:hypothetical protein
LKPIVYFKTKKMKAILFDSVGKMLASGYFNNSNEALTWCKSILDKEHKSGFFSVCFKTDGKEDEVKEFSHLSLYNKAFNKIIRNILFNDLDWFEGEETFEFIKQIKEECPYEPETLEESQWYESKLIQMDKNELIELAKKFH